MKRQVPVILVIVFSPRDRKLLGQRLAESNYEVLTASDAPEARRVFTELPPDLVIVDVDMLGEEGFGFCRRLRVISDVPIIVLSSRVDANDKIMALNLGVDDYLVKPADMSELLARVNAKLRRQAQGVNTKNDTRDFGEFSIDFGARRVMRSGKEVKLTPTEFALLSLFVRNAGRVLAHRYVLNAIWGSAYTEEREYLRAYVYNLRRKIEPNARMPTHILNVPGVGYQFALATSALEREEKRQCPGVLARASSP